MNVNCTCVCSIKLEFKKKKKKKKKNQYDHTSSITTTLDATRNVKRINFVYFYLLIVRSTTYSGSCGVESKKIIDITSLKKSS